MKISSWGLLDNQDHQVFPVSSEDLRSDFGVKRLPKPGIAYGMGRSYGDAATNDGGVLWSTGHLRRFLAFDKAKGILRVESGVTLKEVQELVHQAGWTLPVVPGTQYVSVGGAIANDIHGKSHHTYGTFGHHLLSLTLARTTGEIILCSPRRNKGWFQATVGGIGLTGIILEATIQLVPYLGPWIKSESMAFHDVEEFFNMSEESHDSWESTVAWIDCNGKRNGRGIFTRGNPVRRDAEVKPGKLMTIPPYAGPSLVNSLSIKGFNQLYYQRERAKARQALKLDGPQYLSEQSFYYPLDSLLKWNRIYGRNGFFQYQSVVPHKDGVEVTKEMLSLVARHNEGSFLTVLKVFGDKPSLGTLSFPDPGFTLAIDFPNRGSRSLKLFNELDKIVEAAKGKLYLAKDARMSREFFERTYPQFNKITPYRDPGISSAMSRRLLGS